MPLQRTLSPIVYILFLLFWPTLVQANFQAGMDAYDRVDYETALKEWRPLAAQGLAGAQFGLGVMYEFGQGVPQDYVQAQMWLNLSAAQGQEEAVNGRELIAKKMTPTQLAEAQRLARECLAHKANAIAVAHSPIRRYKTQSLTPHGVRLF